MRLRIWSPSLLGSSSTQRPSSATLTIDTAIRKTDSSLFLRVDPESTAPLDALYTGILSVVSHIPQNLSILHLIWRGDFNPEEVDLILQLREGTSRRILSGLCSLLHVPKLSTRFSQRSAVKFLHASFHDFLCDERRSGRWCVATSWLESDCLGCMIHLLSTTRHIVQNSDFYQ